MPPSASRRMKSSSSSSRVCASSAESGSSSSRIAGRTASARAMPTRWRMPPESCFGQAFRKSASPVRRSASATIDARSAAGRPVCSSTNSTFCATVRQGSSAKSWNTKVSGLMLPGGGRPRNAACPAVGCSRPPRICSSVLLPQPEGPTTATTSPEPTAKETPSSTSSVPKRWPIWSAISSISIRLHVIFCDDRIDRKSLIDESLLLQPAELVGDVVDVEPAFRVDIGAVADHLLDRQVGVFGDDLEQRLGLVVDRGYAVLHRGQDHVVVFAVGASQHAQEFRHERLVGERLRRGEHRAQLPWRL